jgi:hypothetical protein
MVAGSGGVEDELGLAKVSGRPVTAGRRAVAFTSTTSNTATTATIAIPATITTTTTTTTTMTTTATTTSIADTYGLYDEVEGDEMPTLALNSSKYERYSDALHNAEAYFPRQAYLSVCVAGERSKDTNSDSASWNSRLQACLDMPDDPDPLTKYRRLGQLSTDFCEAATTFGKIVISEHLLHDDLKTLPTTNIGGVAGGAKYVVRGILFKLVKDPMLPSGHHLYGGDEIPSYE